MEHFTFLKVRYKNNIALSFYSVMLALSIHGLSSISPLTVIMVLFVSVQCQSLGAGQETEDEHWGQKKHLLCDYDQWRLPGCIWETAQVCH